MGSGADITSIGGLVVPNDLFSNLDGQTTGLKSGGGDGDDELVAGFTSRFGWSGNDWGDGLSTGGSTCLDSGLCGAGLVGVNALFHEEEIVDSGVDESTDDEVENEPLPKRTLSVRGRVFHRLT